MKQSKSAQLSKMLMELYNLEEQNDISREEQFNIRFDNESSICSSQASSINQKKSSHFDIESPQSAQNSPLVLGTMKKINKIQMLPIYQNSVNSSNYASCNEKNLEAQEKIRGLGDMCRKTAQSKWDTTPSKVYQKNISHNVEEVKFEAQIKNLQELNRKLFEDNKALMKECIHLKKILLSGQYCDVFLEFQREKIQMLNEINKLKVKNLTEAIQLNRERNSSKGETFKNEEIQNLLYRISQQNEKIAERVEEIQMKYSQRKYETMKNSNGFTFSTQESKYSDQEHLSKDMLNSIMKTKVEESRSPRRHHVYQSHISIKAQKLKGSPPKYLQR